MSPRAGVLAVALVAALGIAGLSRRGCEPPSAPPRGRSTYLPSVAVIVRHSGQSTCQGPMTTRAPIGSVQTWISPATASGVIPQTPIPGASLDLTVRDAVTDKTLARGQIAAGYTRPIAPVVALDQAISSGRRIRVCLRSRGPGAVDLMGAALPNQALVDDDGTASGAGQAAIALLFIRPHPRSVLSLVPTIFVRASLFRPGWVGPWAYWLLSVALLSTFGLAALAVARAVRADGLHGDGHESVE